MLSSRLPRGLNTRLGHFLGRQNVLELILTQKSFFLHQFHDTSVPFQRPQGLDPKISIDRHLPLTQQIVFPALFATGGC
jgi:hypothetical protein